MRRPSIPFEAIGLHARLRAQPLRATREPARNVTMRPYTHVEPRTEVSDAALASGDLNAWKQILGLSPDPNEPAPPVTDPTPSTPPVEPPESDWDSEDDEDFEDEDDED